MEAFRLGEVLGGTWQGCSAWIVHDVLPELVSNRDNNSVKGSFALEATPTASRPTLQDLDAFEWCRSARNSARTGARMNPSECPNDFPRKKRRFFLLLQKEMYLGTVKGSFGHYFERYFGHYSGHC